ncbi:MAG: hypothetical protein ABEJ69_03920 [Candidatus Nanohaloarchaea archaeon]
MSIEGYSFTGDEFLDQLDELKAANQSVEPVVRDYVSAAENGGKGLAEDARALKTVLPHVFEPYHRIDQMVRNEQLEVPVQFIRNGERYMSWMSLKGDDFEGIIPGLEEIEQNYPMNLSRGKIDYSEVGMPVALVDYAQDTVDAWREMRANYWRVGEAENELNGELEQTPVEYFLEAEEPAYRKGAEKIVSLTGENSF